MGFATNLGCRLHQSVSAGHVSCDSRQQTLHQGEIAKICWFQLLTTLLTASPSPTYVHNTHK